MNYYSTQITNLIEELRRLPGIGSKSAQRLAGIMYFAEYIRKVKVLFILSLNIYEREFFIRFIITVIS